MALFVSSGTRLLARLANATNRPSGLMVANLQFPLASLVPSAATLTSSTVPSFTSARQTWLTVLLTEPREIQVTKRPSALKARLEGGNGPSSLLNTNWSRAQSATTTAFVPVV
jgi:hypothetical protein